MRSPSLWLLEKELRELAASRAYWLLLLIIGPLVGHAFITAVDSYAEASGIGGGSAALAQGLSPLDGILVPTFGAYDLAVTLLFPFVAIRLVSAERESGAWKLMLQAPVSVPVLLSIKAFALLICWAVAWIPGLVAIVLWKIYGGHLYAPELLNLLLGHFLRALTAMGVALAAAAVTSGAAGAAIVTLGFTVGTWALDFIAAGRGGWLRELAAYTPAAALRNFEQGLFNWHVALAMFASGAAGLVFASIWLTPARRLMWRARWTAAVIAVLAVGALIPDRSGVDLSENRRNSFPAAATAALSQIGSPLQMTVHLAAEDPRLMDLDRNVIRKLRRAVRQLEISYAARSRSGLFEGAQDHYGEIWYELDGRKAMSRSTTEAIVIETILKLAQVPLPAESGDPAPGYPLAVHADWAMLLFYLLWPVAVAGAWWLNSALWS